MTIYDRIKALRISKKMSQTDLALKMGYKDGSMITKIESGKVDISQKKVVAFAKALDTTPAYLMGWTDDHPQDPLSEYVPKTVEARSLAMGMDKMPEETRKVFMQMFIDLRPDLFKKGTENDET